MKVLLCEDIKNLGWFGDVVDVKTGYARNYLLPQGLAKNVSDATIRSIAEEKAKRAEQRIKDARRLQDAAGQVNGAEAVLSAKANEQGHLYGSITAEQIADNLRKQGFQVADEVVIVSEHIKEVGTHTVNLRFSKDVTASVSVVVVPEQKEEEAKEE